MTTLEEIKTKLKELEEEIKKIENRDTKINDVGVLCRGDVTIEGLKGLFGYTGTCKIDDEKTRVRDGVIILIPYTGVDYCERKAKEWIGERQQ